VREREIKRKEQMKADNVDQQLLNKDTLIKVWYFNYICII